jgi:hypothetical protein
MPSPICDRPSINRRERPLRLRRRDRQHRQSQVRLHDRQGDRASTHAPRGHQPAGPDVGGDPGAGTHHQPRLPGLNPLHAPIPGGATPPLASSRAWRPQRSARYLAPSSSRPASLPRPREFCRKSLNGTPEFRAFGVWRGKSQYSKAVMSTDRSFSCACAGTRQFLAQSKVLGILE